MTTWYGKQPGADDPTLAHSGGVDAFTSAYEFTGEQPGDVPVIYGSVRKRPQDES